VMICKLFFFVSIIGTVLSLDCMHNAGVTTITNDGHGVLTESAVDKIEMGVIKCDPALDRCVNFASIKVSDFMKLDVAVKDPTYTAKISTHNGNVYGRACMSQRDCDTIKAQKADICEGSSQPSTFSCYCTTSECTIDKEENTKDSSLECMHNAGVTTITSDEHGVGTESTADKIAMGVIKCDPALDRCVNFASMKVADFMKLDVAAKDPVYTAKISTHNGNVYGRACMSQRDCDTIKAQKADICDGSFQRATVSCYCSTSDCTGDDDDDNE
ncbi:hypothetical protein PENTCL1PPCAC_1085, partial [Pristionchus entomophagus]